MQKLDHVIVKAPESKAPGASISDFASLYRMTQKGELVSAFSERERNGFLSTLHKYIVVIGLDIVTPLRIHKIVPAKLIPLTCRC
jgi:hypothetical protein